MSCIKMTNISIKKNPLLKNLTELKIDFFKFSCVKDIEHILENIKSLEVVNFSYFKQITDKNIEYLKNC